jgi:hypothetical protein
VRCGAAAPRCIVQMEPSEHEARALNLKRCADAAELQLQALAAVESSDDTLYKEAEDEKWLTAFPKLEAIALELRSFEALSNLTRLAVGEHMQLHRFSDPLLVLTARSAFWNYSC